MTAPCGPGDVSELRAARTGNGIGDFGAAGAVQGLRRGQVRDIHPEVTEPPAGFPVSRD